MNRLARWQLSLRRKDKGFLFDGDDAVFKALLPQTTTYAEYGVGKSSLWVLANTRASILAVDTSNTGSIKCAVRPANPQLASISTGSI